MQPGVEHFFLLWITTNIRVKADNFVHQYYVDKGVTRVTVFSCDQAENDYNFVRRMSELEIYAAVHHPRSKFYDASKSRIVNKDYRPLGLVLDLRCQTREAIEKIVDQTTQYRLYEGIHIWLILTTSLDQTVRLLNDSAYSLLTELTVAVEIERGYELYDVYNPCKLRSGSLNVTTLGFWDIDRGFNITLTESKFRRRSDLRGMRVKVVSVVKHQPPDKTVQEHLEDYATKSLDPISKYGWGIARHIADLFNYTMEVETVGDWIVTTNGTEHGMMPMLDRGEVDIGISPCPVPLEYLARPYGHMLIPGYPYRTFFILRSNEAAELNWMELATPFAFDSWYAIVLTGMISIIVITTIQSTEYGEGWLSESGHAIFATIGALSQQGLTFVPNRIAGRLAFLFILFLGVLLSNYYGASIVSSLLNEPGNKMNDSLYSLAKSRITLSSEPFSYVDDNLAFRATTDWEVHYFNEKVWTNLPLSKYVLPEDGLGRVAGGGYAYHTSAEVAYPYVDAHWDDEAICDMTEIHVTKPRILSFWERVDSPFTELMKVGLIKTANMGLRSRAIKRWKPKTPYCPPNTRSLQSIRIYDIAVPAVMFGIGVALSLAICYGESVAYKLQPDGLEAPIKQKKLRVAGKKTLQRN